MRWGMLIKAQERQYYAARQAIGVQSGCLDNFNFVCEHEVKLFADNLTLLTKQSNFAASDWLEPGFGWVPVEIEIPTKSSVRSQFFGGQTVWFHTVSPFSFSWFLPGWSVRSDHDLLHNLVSSL